MWKMWKWEEKCKTPCLEEGGKQGETRKKWCGTHINIISTGVEKTNFDITALSLSLSLSLEWGSLDISHFIKDKVSIASIFFLLTYLSNQTNGENLVTSLSSIWTT